MVGMKIFRFVLLMSAILLALGMPLAHAAAQTAAVVAVAPADFELGAGMTADLAIEVRDVQDLYGIDITVLFDPAVVEVVDANPSLAGDQVSLGVFLEGGMAVINQADNAAGSVHFVMTQLNPAEPKSGSGNLLVIRFRGKQPGTSPVTLVDAQLATRDGESIDSSRQDGQIRVAAQVSGPTATPIPVQDPGSIQMFPTQDGAAPTGGPQITLPTATLAGPAATQPPAAGATETVGQPTPAAAAERGEKSALTENWWMLLVLAALVAGMAVLYTRTRAK